MYIYANISRLAFYVLLGFEAWLGEIPWWVAGGFVLWDNSVNLLFKVPFTGKKAQAGLSQNDPTLHYPYYYGSQQTGGNGGTGTTGAEG